MEKVGFIGTGLMGYPMVERLLDAGYAVVVYNRTRQKAEPLAARGAQVEATPASVFEQADVVMTMVSDGKAVEAVLFQASPPVPLQGKTVIQMSTIGPAESETFAGRVQAAGGTYLEAPVLGSIPQVKSGSLIVMVGATEAQYQKYAPLLEVFGPDPVWVGPVGKASRLKLAMNQLIASLAAAFAVSLGLVMKSDIDVGVFMNVLRRSALYAPMFDNKLDRMVQGQFDNPNFPLRLMVKDVDLILELAQSLQVDTRLLKTIRAILQDGMEQGRGEQDYSALMEAIVPRAS